MRIAFTSCQDVVRDRTQHAWAVVAAQQPEHLILLGDNIYMDYKFDGDHLSAREVRKLSLRDFSALMHERYARQWAVTSFQQAIRATKGSVYALWDDHDFAWNNSHGAGDRDDEYVPPEHRRLSRLHFEQFRKALAARTTGYPSNPCPDGIVPPDEDLGGVQQTFNLAPNVRLHLLDGRSFREAPGGFFHRLLNRHPDAHLLGEQQREALGHALLPPDQGINLLASGTTLEDWAKYMDLGWLKAKAKNHRIVVLSGDVHHPLAQDRGRHHRADGQCHRETAGADQIGQAQDGGVLHSGGEHTEPEHGGDLLA